MRFFQFILHCYSAHCNFSCKKPPTFAPAIERDAVVKGLEGLKILKKISDNLDRKNKSHYLCSHVSESGAVKRKRSLKELHINK